MAVGRFWGDPDCLLEVFCCKKALIQVRVGEAQVGPRQWICPVTPSDGLRQTFDQLPIIGGGCLGHLLWGLAGKPLTSCPTEYRDEHDGTKVAHVDRARI